MPKEENPIQVKFDQLVSLVPGKGARATGGENGFINSILSSVKNEWEDPNTVFDVFIDEFSERAKMKETFNATQRSVMLDIVKLAREAKSGSKGGRKSRKSKKSKKSKSRKSKSWFF